MQILVIGHLQMTFGGIWDNKIYDYFFIVLGSFGSQKCKCCSLNMTFGGIWSNNKIVTNFGTFDPQKRHFWPPEYANFGHGRPPNNSWGHVEQNSFVCKFRHFWSPKFGHGISLNYFRGHFESKTKLFQILAFLTPKYAHLGHGTPNDF